MLQAVAHSQTMDNEAGETEIENTVQPRHRKKLARSEADGVFGLIAEYFEKNGTQIKCKITDCNASLSRWTIYYLKRHLEPRHYSIFADIFVNEANKAKQIAGHRSKPYKVQFR